MRFKGQAVSCVYSTVATAPDNPTLNPEVAVKCSARCVQDQHACIRSPQTLCTARGTHRKWVASWVFRTGSMSTSFTTTFTSDPEKPSVRAASDSKSDCVAVCTIH